MFTWSAGECDEEIYNHGVPIINVSGSSAIIQTAVEDLSNKSGCKCDWHYVGGVAIIKTMPENRDKVIETILDEAWEDHLAEMKNDQQM